MIITAGAISAVIGVVQFGILEFDSLGQRPGSARDVHDLLRTADADRVHRRARVCSARTIVCGPRWYASADCRARGDAQPQRVGWRLRRHRSAVHHSRLPAVRAVPVALAAFIAFAPSQMTDRLYSSFRVKHLRHDTAATEASLLSNRDRLAMIRSGFRIIKADPLTGVGPDMVIKVYAFYRDANAVQQLNSHLHNVPLQIAAERGLPALAIWIWFMVTLIRDFVKNRMKTDPSLAYGALAVTVAMIAAGMFEYNFGDSEVLMLFLVLVTLPYAASRSTPASPPA